MLGKDECSRVNYDQLDDLVVYCYQEHNKTRLHKHQMSCKHERFSNLDISENTVCLLGVKLSKYVSSQSCWTWKQIYN